MAYTTETRPLDRRDEIILSVLATLVPLLTLAGISF